MEKAVEGTCARCSVGCGVEYRWHGTLFTRVTERYGAPNNGMLCKKGRFGLDFLNEPLPGPVNLGAAADRARALLRAAHSPLMRISPFLCGEAIEVFLEAAQRRGIAVQAAGLENLDPGWLELAAASPAAGGGTVPAVPAGGAASAIPGAPPARPLVILVGDIAFTNNVAFTEAFRRRRAGDAELWIAGHDDETARRAADRVFPDVAAAADAAVERGTPVEIWVNPEESRAGALKALQPVRGRARVHLLWSSRNAGCLAGKQKAPKRKPDLYLDVGVEDGANGDTRIVWGCRKPAKGLFIPLPRELWIYGASHPTGLPAAAGPAVDMEAVRKAAAVISEG